MDQDLAEKIYWILIEEGQHNLKFPLGGIITNTPDEVRDIIQKHIKELTQSDQIAVAEQTRTELICAVHGELMA